MREPIVKREKRMKAFLKPFLAVMLVLCLILAMVACGDQEGKVGDTADDTDAVAIEGGETSEKEETSSTKQEALPNLKDGGSLTETGWSGMATEFDAPTT